ncbi:PQQ-binding-like beta-propeller repeat protein [Streptomyces sp. NBC_01142]|nr:PQQ-binding-like beta-propeller repeat protein [Streptomyces sp. NBC_01142]
MEPLQQDDPRRIGPFTVRARHRESAVCVHYLAHGPDGTAMVVSLARPELAALVAFRRRFQRETRRAEQLAGGWVAPIEARTDGEQLWTASPYVPALTLREAIALAGPLPERAVRILGAGLAETLSRVHATGAVLHGLAPDTVLIAADGPRLTAFGALGAAAVAEARPDGQLSVKLDYLTPEQAAGAKPGPASDMFVLGLLLAYAATGTTPLADADRIAHGEPELDGVPGELRPLVSRCLAKRPEDRPSAGTVAADLALEGAAALAREGWLPASLAAAIEAQAIKVPTEVASPAAQSAGSGTSGVAAEAERAGSVTPEPVDAVAARHAGGAGPQAAGTRPPGGDRSGPGDGARADRGTTVLAIPPARGAAGTAPAGAVPMPAGPPPTPGMTAPPAAVPLGVPFGVPPTAPTAPASPPTPKPDRRALLIGIVAGAAGLAVGGGGVYAAAGEDADVKAEPAEPPAPRPSKMAGLPPDPLWRYEHPGTDTSPLRATVWRDRVLVLTSEEQSSGVDLRTGRRLWERREAGSLSRAVPVNDELCLVDARDELLWISAQSGKLEHRIAKTTLAGPGETLTFESVSGWEGSTVWLTGHVRKGKKLRTYLFAYDTVARKWQWRTGITDGKAPHTPRYGLVAVRSADIVLRQDSRSLTPAQVKGAKGRSVLHTFDRASGKLLSSRPLTGVGPTAGVVGDASGRLFAAAGRELHAFTSGDGKRLWRVPGAETPGKDGVFAYGTPTLRGPALYVANRYQQVSAVDTATGRRLWTRSTEAPAWDDTPGTALSTSGRTVLAADGAQLTAFSARDGKRLWKFQEAGTEDAPDGEATSRYEALQGGGRNLVVRRDRTFYALPVE